MQRKLVISLVSLFLLHLALASVTLNNYTLETSYFSGDTISGTLNITISDEPASTLITSNLNGEMTIEDFLNANNKDNFCSVSDCESDYEASNQSAEKTLTLTGASAKTIGFVLTGDDVDIQSLNFSISSDFEESEDVPFHVEYLGSEEWDFLNFSNNYADSISSYDESSQNGVQALGTLEYCQEVSLVKTKSLQAGAYIQETFDNITMNLHISGDSPVAQCSFVGGEGCKLELDEGFIEGDYYVCAKNSGDQSLNILTEDVSSKKDGAVLNDGSFTAQDVNYGVFIMPETYADASLIEMSEIFSSFPTVANNYIDNHYGGDCLDSCIFPITFDGIPQTIDLSGLQLRYTVDSGAEVDETNFYDISETDATVNYEGTLDIDELGFEISDETEFKLYFDGTEILNEEVAADDSLIDNLYPLSVPAGVPIAFKIISEVDNFTEIKWDFGDGFEAESTEKEQEHTYQNISNYTLEVTATYGSSNETKTFEISVFSPEEITEYMLERKLDTIEYLDDKADDYSFSEEIKEALDLVSLKTELEDLQEDFNDSTTDSTMITIAEALFELIIPAEFVVSKTTDFLIFDDADIDLSVLETISGDSTDSEGDYETAIQRWFANEMVVDIEKETVVVTYEDGEEETAVQSYELTIESSSEDKAYFVIDSALADLEFSSGVEAVSAGTSSYFEIEAGETKTVTFTLISSTVPTFFVSPEPSKLSLEDTLDVNEECNFDGICGDGENSENCRDDCKPTSLLLIYAVLLLILFGAAFIGVTLWYQRHKEEILFGDRKQLFNLLVFVKNAKEKGMKKQEVVKVLIEKGWTQERVNYAISKAERIDKVGISSFNNFIDKRIYSKNAVTQTKQQPGPKINKPNFQRMNRKR